ncbi:MAG: hypothetical protein ACXW5U_05125 [Thermoanaerobaculia bacterium]
MNLTTTNRERTLDELLDRVLPKMPKGQRAEARKRLVDANRHLEKLQDLPAGTPVLIPAELQQGAVSGVIEERLRSALGTAFDAMQQGRADLQREIEAEEQAVKRAADLLRTPEVKAARKDDPDLGKRLDDATRAAAEAGQERNAQRKVLLEAVGESLKLLKNLGGPSR